MAGGGDLVAEPGVGVGGAVDEGFGFGGEGDVVGGAVVGVAELGDGGDGGGGAGGGEFGEQGEDGGPGGVGVGERRDNGGGGGEVEVAFAADELAGEGGDGAGEAVGHLCVGQGCGRRRADVLRPAHLAAGGNGRLHPDQPRVIGRDAQPLQCGAVQLAFPPRDGISAPAQTGRPVSEPLVHLLEAAEELLLGECVAGAG